LKKKEFWFNQHQQTQISAKTGVKEGLREGLRHGVGDFDFAPEPGTDIVLNLHEICIQIVIF